MNKSKCSTGDKTRSLGMSAVKRANSNTKFETKYEKVKILIEQTTAAEILLRYSASCKLPTIRDRNLLSGIQQRYFPAR